tara:strand:+ start:82 stop:510 length:429 start_codon:yes stop_codon:yes gene_type:complete
MKTVFFKISLITFLLFIYSCGTEDSFKKIIVNQSEFDLSFDFNNLIIDTLFILNPGDSLVFSDFTKLDSNHSNHSSSPCSIHKLDTISVIVNSNLNFYFNGNFRDEYNWEETVSSGYDNFKIYTQKTCLFSVNNDQIIAKSE